MDIRKTVTWKRIRKNVLITKSHEGVGICHICELPIEIGAYPAKHNLSVEIDHLLSIKTHPELAFEMDNLELSHKYCNAAKKEAVLTPSLKRKIREGIMKIIAKEEKVTNSKRKEKTTEGLPPLELLSSGVDF